jgi:hypothetical protein
MPFVPQCTQVLFKITNFSNIQPDIFVLLGCYTVQVGNWLSMFQGNLMATHSMAKSHKIHSILEVKHEWTDKKTAKTHSIDSKASQKA